MNHQPDPNLDDDNLIQAMAENEQALALGESCRMCEAEPRNHILTHKAGCLYPIVLNLIETMDVVEAFLDAQEAS